MWSAAYKPFRARFLDSRQTSGCRCFPACALKQGAFAPPALPGFITTTPPSVIRNSRDCPSRAPRCPVAGRAPSRTSLVARSITPMRAATATTVESTDAFLARFSIDVGLPRYYGELASTTAFRGLLGAYSRCSPHGLLISFEAFSRSASAHSLPREPPLVLPAGAKVGRVGFHRRTDEPLQGTHNNWVENAFARSRWGARTGCLPDQSGRSERAAAIMSLV